LSTRNNAGSNNFLVRKGGPNKWRTGKRGHNNYPIIRKKEGSTSRQVGTSTHGKKGLSFERGKLSQVRGKGI